MVLTSRERVRRALNHQELDRTPIFEYVLLSPIAEQILGRPYAEEPGYWSQLVDRRGWESAVRQIVLDRLDLAGRLGHDLLYVVPNPPPDMTEPVGVTSADIYCPDPVEIIRQRNRKPKGKHPLQDDAYRVYVYLKEEMQRRGLDLPIMAPAYQHGVWTDVALMQTMILEPDIAEEHFSIATQQALAMVEKYFELGIDLIGIGGDFAGNRPLISPEAYRRFIVPELRILSRRIHGAGGCAINASDGNLWSVIDDFLIRTEVDGYIEIDLHAGMDLKTLKDRFGNRVTFLGNLDCGNTLSFGSTEEVRRHTLECLEAGLGNGGHILTASNAITGSVPMRNYLAMVNAYREMFNLPSVQLD